MQFFSSCASTSEQRESLGEFNKQQIIFEAETFFAVLAYWLWFKRLELRSSTLYVDNEGTKFCMMKGSSKNVTFDLYCGI
jgi:hypothetical protein